MTRKIFSGLAFAVLMFSSFLQLSTFAGGPNIETLNIHNNTNQDFDWILCSNPDNVYRDGIFGNEENIIQSNSTFSYDIFDTTYRSDFTLRLYRATELPTYNRRNRISSDEANSYCTTNTRGFVDSISFDINQNQNVYLNGNNYQFSVRSDEEILIDDNSVQLFPTPSLKFLRNNEVVCVNGVNKYSSQSHSSFDDENYVYIPLLKGINNVKYENCENGFYNQVEIIGEHGYVYEVGYNLNNTYLDVTKTEFKNIGGQTGIMILNPIYPISQFCINGRVYGEGISGMGIVEFEVAHTLPVRIGLINAFDGCDQAYFEFETYIQPNSLNVTYIGYVADTIFTSNRLENNEPPKIVNYIAEENYSFDDLQITLEPIHNQTEEENSDSQDNEDEDNQEDSEEQNDDVVDDNSDDNSNQDGQDDSSQDNSNDHTSDDDNSQNDQQNNNQNYQPPAIKDSNRKIGSNELYQISLSEILEDYIQPLSNSMTSFRLDEDVLHGYLTLNGYTPIVGQVYDISEINNGFYYISEVDFQGADHFKWQAFDGLNWSNISSFNFDILRGFNSDDSNNGQGGGSDNDNDSTDSNDQNDNAGGNNDDSNNGIDNSTNPVNNQDDNSLPVDNDDYFGIGGGGDGFVFPSTTNSSSDSNQEQETPTGSGGDGLIRTGGYSSPNNLPSLLIVLGAATLLAVKRINSK